MVGIHYRLLDEDGKELDSSSEEGPLSYLHGHEQIIPALEVALEGMVAGDTTAVTVPPDKGFGDRDPERIVNVPRSQFDFDIGVGAVVQAVLPAGGTHHLQVIDLTDTTVTLDGNHPLAGKTISFDVTVESVRTATTKELDQARSGDESNEDVAGN